MKKYATVKTGSPSVVGICNGWQLETYHLIMGWLLSLRSKLSPNIIINNLSIGKS